jgi:putative Ca2+/H+ antiporter (TMEM165/GDT1 family)
VNLLSVPSSAPAPASQLKSLPEPDLKLESEYFETLRVECTKEPATFTQSQETSPAGTRKQSKGFSVFWSTFITIFLAEIGDKTQVTTLLMSAESHAPWVVFAGAGTALVATSLIGVLLGQWLSKILSPKTLEKSAGVMMLLISAMLLWDVLH